MWKTASMNMTRRSTTKTNMMHLPKVWSILIYPTPHSLSQIFPSRGPKELHYIAEAVFQIPDKLISQCIDYLPTAVDVKLRVRIQVIHIIIHIQIVYWELVKAMSPNCWYGGLSNYLHDHINALHWLVWLFKLIAYRSFIH